MGPALALLGLAAAVAVLSGGKQGAPTPAPLGAPRSGTAPTRTELRPVDGPSNVELATLARAAVYIGPLDTPETRHQIESLRLGANTDLTRQQLMGLVQTATSWGLDGNPIAVPPDPNGNAVQRWNYTQSLILRAAVEWACSYATSPHRHNVRLMTVDLLRWAQADIANPPCDFVYQGAVPIDDVYDRTHTPHCRARQDRYLLAFRAALESWRDARGIHAEVPHWHQWDAVIPSWGTELDQAALVDVLRPALLSIGTDKMVIWPGGPPSGPGPEGEAGANVAAGLAILAALAVAAA